MAKTSMKIKQARPAKFSTSAVVHMLILKSMVSVEFASVNWLIRVRSRELRKPAGRH